jgi:hypothetical protein
MSLYRKKLHLVNRATDALRGIVLIIAGLCMLVSAIAYYQAYLAQQHIEPIISKPLALSATACLGLVALGSFLLGRCFGKVTNKQ